MCLKSKENVNDYIYHSISEILNVIENEANIPKGIDTTKTFNAASVKSLIANIAKKTRHRNQ